MSQKEGKKKNDTQKNPLAPMGVLAHGSAHACPPLSPPSTLAEFVSANVSEGGGYVSVLQFNVFSSNCAVLMKTPREHARGAS